MNRDAVTSTAEVVGLIGVVACLAVESWALAGAALCAIAVLVAYLASDQ